MQLEPLKQWICDECGEIISKPEDGWVEWYADENDLRQGFRIVHHAGASPLKELGSDCYKYTNYHYRLDTYLTEFINDIGIVRMLSLIDLGPYFQPEYKGPRVKNLRELVELFRRLHLPYYEEARLYWAEASSGGYFCGWSEIYMYMPDNLKNLIKFYKSQEELK